MSATAGGGDVSGAEETTAYLPPPMTVRLSAEDVVEVTFAVGPVWRWGRLRWRPTVLLTSPTSGAVLSEKRGRVGSAEAAGEWLRQQAGELAVQAVAEPPPPPGDPS